MTLAEDEALAAAPDTPDDALIRLLSHRSWQVRWNAAQNRGASDAVRLAALATGDKDLAAAVGQLGDALSSTVLEAVFEHPKRDGREQLGCIAHDRTTQERLASDPDLKVRASLAGNNEDVPEDLVRKLAADRRAEVRACVACRHALPEDLVITLASDRSALVRWWLIFTRNTREVAELLRDDPDEVVRDQARGVLGEPPD
ncbi:hypothetical protein [Demequina sp. NBRC 110054]|uniref:hypothetical protein n=1 Tax=Demequina sp. NBRC 110054 TaxID=1570343 RepID=UPI0009FEEAAC|nr:hypothetical protein [Demequina sp. NBRC 110054]